jgi:pilus assembly protein CpaB
MPRGTVIEESAFGPRDVPAKFVHAAIDPDRVAQLTGQKLAAPLEKGEILLSLHVEPPNQAFSATLANGNRALTTEVDEVNSISGMLRPTDRIDLMATARGSGSSSRDVTFPLLSNVEVLATGQVTRQGEDGEETEYTTITLSLSPHDAQRIVVAKASGKLTAVLRNPEDVAPSAISAMSIDDVVPKAPVKKGRRPVEYIVGT